MRDKVTLVELGIGKNEEFDDEGSFMRDKVTLVK